MNEVVEFIGILSVDPSMANFTIPGKTQGEWGGRIYWYSLYRPFSGQLPGYTVRHKVNDVVEFIGILSVDPSMDSFQDTR